MEFSRKLFLLDLLFRVNKLDNIVRTNCLAILGDSTCAISITNGYVKNEIVGLLDKYKTIKDYDNNVGNIRWFDNENDKYIITIDFKQPLFTNCALFDKKQIKELFSGEDKLMLSIFTQQR